MATKLNPLQIKERTEVLEKIKKIDASLSLLFEMHFLDSESEFPIAVTKYHFPEEEPGTVEKGE